MDDLSGLTLTATVLSGALVGLLVSLLNVLVRDWYDGIKEGHRRTDVAVSLYRELSSNGRWAQEAFTSGQRRTSFLPQGEYGGPMESVDNTAFLHAVQMGATARWPIAVEEKVSRAYSLIASILRQRSLGKVIMVVQNGATEIRAVDEQGMGASISDGGHLLVYLNDARAAVGEHLGKKRPPDTDF